MSRPARQFPDIQSFMRVLEERGELLRVREPVSRDLEITEISDRLVKKGGPAVLFENVVGSDYPVVMGLMGTRERMARTESTKPSRAEDSQTRGQIRSR